MEGILDRIESDTGVARNPDESPAEYVWRVADRANVDEAVTRRTVAELEGASRRPGIEPNQQVFAAFFADVTDRSDPEGPPTAHDRGTGCEWASSAEDPRTEGAEIEAGRDDLPDQVARPTAGIERQEITGNSRLSGVRAVASNAGTRFRGLRRIGDPSDHVFVGALLLLGWYVLYRSLGDHSLYAWDEGIYANAGKQAVTEGYWLVPHTNGYLTYGPGYQPFLEKPPLVFWLQGLSMKLFGVNEFAARFQSATFTVLTAVLIYLVGREVLDRRVGFLGGIAYLTFPAVAWGPNGAVHASTDMAVVFFGSAMTYLVWRSIREDDPRWLVYASLPATGAVMSKGFDAGVWMLVPVPLLLLSPWLLVSRDMAKGVGITTALCSLWPLYAWFRYGREFVRVIFVKEVWFRILRGRGEGVGSPLFEFMDYPYIRALPTDLDPWVYLLVPGVVYLVAYYWRSGRRRETKALLFVVWWFVCIFGFYVRVGENLTYTLKAYVPAALLVGWFLAKVSRGRRYSWVALLVGAGSMLAFSPRMEGLSPATYSPVTQDVLAWGGPLVGWKFGVLVAVSVVVLALYPWLSRITREVVEGGREGGSDTGGESRLSAGGYRTAGLVVSVAFVLGVAVALGGPGLAPHTSPQEELGGVIDEETPEGATVYVTDAAEIAGISNYAPLGFYTDREIGGAYYRKWEFREDEQPNTSDVQYVLSTEEQLHDNEIGYGIDTSRDAIGILHRHRNGYHRNGETTILLLEVGPRTS